MKNVMSSMRTGRASLALLIGLNVAFYLLLQLPFFSILVEPLQTFVTTLHESSHAVACYLTGGRVIGLTIVPDASMHAAGVTWCRGSQSPIILYSAGYLGAAFLGCMLIWLARDRERAPGVLQFMAVVLGLISAYVMAQGFFNRLNTVQVTESIFIGITIAFLLGLAGNKLSATTCQFLLLILGGQTALNAIHSIFYLVQVSLGMLPGGGLSDAMLMWQYTGIPAGFWSFAWGLSSVAMLYYTIKWCYIEPDKP